MGLVSEVVRIAGTSKIWTIAELWSVDGDHEARDSEREEEQRRGWIQVIRSAIVQYICT